MKSADVRRFLSVPALSSTVAGIAALVLSGAALAQATETLRPWAECSMADPAEYRPAEAQDYAGLAWQHWKTHTGSETPWRARADFDGDGQLDTAWVAIHRQQPQWMAGVDYGRGADEPCRVQQMLSLDDMARLPALLAWPLGVDSLVCHGAETGYAARCRAPDWPTFATRDGAALIAADALPVQVHLLVNHWQRVDVTQPLGYAPARPGDKGAKRMFEVRDFLPELDTQASQRVLAPKNAKASTPAVLQTAFDVLARARHYTVRTETGEPGSLFHSVTEDRRLAPDSLHRIEQRGDQASELIALAGRGWMRGGGADWQSVPAEAIELLAPRPQPPQMVNEPQSRLEDSDGRRVQVIEGRVSQPTGDGSYRAELDPNSGRLLLERIDYANGIGEIVVRYDYDTPVTMPDAPEA